MRIGEVSKRTGVATRMLRYYEEQGLLSPQRHPNGYRNFTPEHVAQVEMIRDLSSSGVPTRFIRIILDREDDTSAWTAACDEILAGMVREQITDIDAKIACLTSSRSALARLLADAGVG
ncbi:MAG: MerR family transcriptional regulator [Gordonia sp. (in: high G+C Gram-positive bacteria)]